jgi:hypothetical protein
MNSNKKIWFPAKKYGWGWGPPCSWEGWVVLFIYIILALVGGLLLGNRPGLFIPYMICISGLFVAVAWIKGEPPKWRWGDKE